MPRVSSPSGLALLLLVSACASDPATEPELEFTLVEGSWEEQAPTLDPTASCIHEGQLRRPAWWTADLQLWIQYPGQEPLQLSGDFTTLWPFHVAFGSEQIAVARVNDISLFDRASGVRQHRWEFETDTILELHIDDRGKVVASLQDQTTGLWSGRLFELEGQTELPAFYPHGPMDARGLIPGAFLDPSVEDTFQPTTGWGWLDPRAPLDHETHLLDTPHRPADELDFREWPRFEGGFIEHVDVDHEDGPRFVRADSSGGVFVELPASESYRYLPAAPGYRLLELADSSLVRIDTNAGRAEPVSFDLFPSGAAPLPSACVEPSYTVDSSGRVLSVLRRDNVDRVAAWDPESGNWTWLGAPMTRANRYNLDLRGPWILAGAQDANDPNCAPALASESSAFEFDSAQLIDPDTGKYFYAGEYAESVRVDPQGVCLTWNLGSGVYLFDLRDWEELGLPWDGLWGWL